MESLAYLLLPVVLVYIFIRSKRDIAEYQKFKKLTSSAERLQKYRKWLLGSFLIFGLGSLVMLALIGHASNLLHPLSVFTDLIPANYVFKSSVSANSLFGFILGCISGGVAIGVLLKLASLKRRPKNDKTVVLVGDIEALLPRNAKERYWSGLLAINAGISEELFFRLLLPILIFIVFKNALLAVSLSTLVFGAAHYYQGWGGVLLTTILGAILSLVYLATGYIWIAMLIHTFIDFNSLFIQPFIHAFAGRKLTARVDRTV